MMILSHIFDFFVGGRGGMNYMRRMFFTCVWPRMKNVAENGIVASPRQVIDDFPPRTMNSTSG